MPTSAKSPSARSDAPASPARVYRAAVIGCGRIGCAFDDDPKRHGAGSHAGAYVRSQRFELAALCDIDRGRVERYADKFGVRGRYGDITEMLAGESPDVVSICTPADTHESIVRAAVGAGVRGIYCEKPLADSLAAADGMASCCQDAGVPLLVGHQRRFDPLHRDIQRFIHEGRLGDIQQATCYYTAGIANTGSHMIDLLRMFLGEISSVRAEPPVASRLHARHVEASRLRTRRHAASNPHVHGSANLPLERESLLVPRPAGIHSGNRQSATPNPQSNASSVNPQSKIQNPKSPCAMPTRPDPNLNAWLEFTCGATAVLQACDVRAYTIFEVNLLGTLGRLRLMSHGFELDFEDVGEHPRYTGYNGLRNAPPPFAASRASQTPLLFAMENLARALDTGREPLSSAADGRAALEVIAALLESADHGGKRIELPLKQRDRRIAS